MSKIWKAIAFIASIIFFLYSIYFSFFGATKAFKDPVVFVVPQDISNYNISEELYSKKLIKNEAAFNLVKNKFFKKIEFKSGGYNLNTNQSTWQILKKLSAKQDLMWVNLYFCPRKEQVGERLANVLGWDSKKLKEWNQLFIDSDYFEGVFYPDTYLIPIDESVEQVAQRFIDRFNEKFSVISNGYINKNIKWTTGLKIASLIAREAAGKEDSKLISGIIWNRLNQNMRLQIDATMQYTLGKNEKGSWWGSISLEEKQKDSPYNSYRHEGLPPTPICSPNIDFIEAALNPEETECIFYLHDSNRQIHCAKTYKEHKENISKYL